MCIAMEFLSGGELFDYIAEKQGLNESEARNLFSQIASAVQHCHLVSNLCMLPSHPFIVSDKCMILLIH